MSTDILEWIRQSLDSRPLTPESVQETLKQARQTWARDRVYISVRSPEQRQKVSRRTLQRRRVGV
ncbi:MAG: hypothetical protein H6974_12935 [Gammaproteobacteria bacterium]|nr:hypothetical protein [Gammaproteobacteria bacterium]